MENTNSKLCTFLFYLAFQSSFEKLTAYGLQMWSYFAKLSHKANVDTSLMKVWYFTLSHKLKLLKRYEFERGLWFLFQHLLKAVNPFRATGLFRYPPENRKPKVSWCFQGVSKETSGMKWVDVYSKYCTRLNHANVTERVDQIHSLFLSVNLLPNRATGFP